MSDSFANKIRTGKSVCLFGVVPPPQTFSNEKFNKYVDSFLEAIKGLDVDALSIYDIQDETPRTNTERPYRFVQTYEPREFASRIQQRRNIDILLFRAVAEHPKEEFDDWLTDVVGKRQIRNVSLVGASSSSSVIKGFTVMEAAKMMKDKKELKLGGITIPERHRDKQTEHFLLVDKSKAGMKYFTSQVVYNADPAIALLRDYDSLCKESGETPSQIIFTFAPFASEETVTFLRWLGVEVPLGTEKRVLSCQDIDRCAVESVEICRENFRRILEYACKFNILVPIGFTVESVSRKKEERIGAVQLFQILQSELKVFDQQPKETE